MYLDSFLKLPNRLEYSKKKDKKAQIKFIKDESVTKNDMYKSHTVSVASGEPPNSVSRPAAKRKPGVVRPITSGKLLRAGGPSDVCSIFYIPIIELTVSACRSRRLFLSLNQLHDPCLAKPHLQLQLHQLLWPNRPPLAQVLGGHHQRLHDMPLLPHPHPRQENPKYPNIVRNLLSKDKKVK